MRTTLVCLHGWGGSRESFSELRQALSGSAITVLTPNLPGFGSEPEPTRPWSNDDYADWVCDWIQKNAATNNPNEQLFLLGHSHGGRIAIKLAERLSTGTAARHLPIAHLFLCAPAGIKHPRHIKRIIGLTLAKTGAMLLRFLPFSKFLTPLTKKLLYKLVRVHDYERATPLMRETMIKVTRENLRPLLARITIPTDLFWGTDDRMTPYKDALVFKRELRGCTLHTYPSIRHSVHRERAKEIAAVIQARIGAC